MTTHRDIQHDPRALQVKVATRNLIEAVGGVDRAAEVAGRCAASISNYQSPNTDSFMPVDALIALLEVCPHDARAQRIVALIASRAGMVAVERRRGDWSSGDYMALIGELMRGAGALSGDMIEALADKQLDAGERQSLSFKARELAAALLGMSDALERGL